MSESVVSLLPAQLGETVNWGPLLAGGARILLILVLAAVSVRLAKRGVRRGIGKLTGRGTGARAEQRAQTLGSVLEAVVAVAVWTLAAMMILGALQISLGPLIAAAGIVGVAVGFGAQSLVTDVLSGIFMLIEDQYGVGDIVDAGEVAGTVEGLGLRSTRIRALDGTLWHVPNGEIRRVGNMSQQWARAVLDVGISYDASVEQATAVLERAAAALADDEAWSAVFLDAPSVWGVQDLGDSEVTLRLVATVKPAQQWAVERELRARVKAAFDAEQIEIPFPQRDVWLRRGDQEAGELEQAMAS